MPAEGAEGVPHLQNPPELLEVGFPGLGTWWWGDSGQPGVSCVPIAPLELLLSRTERRAGLGRGLHVSGCMGLCGPRWSRYAVGWHCHLVCHCQELGRDLHRAEVP